MDGPEAFHDRNRVDHNNNGSYSSVKNAATLLTSTAKGRRIFGSVLCVIDLANDPIVTYEHFLSLGLNRIDFLLPDVYYPPGKSEFAHTPYADWLIAIFDRWYDADDPDVRVRFFEAIISGLIGESTGLDCLGVDPMGLAVIETDGSLEPLDVMKCTENGLTKLGLNVIANEIDDLKRFDIIKKQLQPDANLSSRCRSCEYRESCGGGYLPHRYNTDGFINPSVYCTDLFKLHQHIADRLDRTLDHLQG
jgi:uncharacterized protein